VPQIPIVDHVVIVLLILPAHASATMSARIVKNVWKATAYHATLWVRFAVMGSVKSRAWKQIGTHAIRAIVRNISV